MSLVKLAFALAVIVCPCFCPFTAKANTTTTFTFASTWISGPNGVGGFDSGRGFLIPDEPIVAASISGTFGTTADPNRAGLDVSINDILVAQCLPQNDCTRSPIPTFFQYDFALEEFGQLRRTLAGPPGLVELVVVELTVSITTATPAPGDADAPLLFTEENSIRGIALDSVTHLRDPFSSNMKIRFSDDPRTRVVLFLTNVKSTPEDALTVSAVAWLTSTHGFSSLTVEDVRPVPDLDGVTQVVVRFPDTDTRELAIRIDVNGKQSNTVVVRCVYPGMSVR
jgi:hypothetical protein